MSKNGRWPENCIWPEPVKDGESDWWEPDEVDPFLLDEDGRELLEIREYFDRLVEEGRLNEDYSLNEDYEAFDEDLGDQEGSGDLDEPEKFEPEIGTDYWDDGFDVQAWEEDFSQHVGLLKINPAGVENDPVIFIREVTGYEFINENLLRQAFTRRSFAVGYGLSGCCEELEFLGDSVLNAIVTREIVGQLMEVNAVWTDAPFRSLRKGYDEGVLSRIRSQYVCREYLAERARKLGLDQFILYGKGEEPTESSREDMMEALIGAVAVDSSWDQKTLEMVVDSLLCVQLTYPDRFLKATHYDLFNAWHQKHFGCIPSYETYDLGKRGTGCSIRFQVPENDRDIPTRQRIDVNDMTRSRLLRAAGLPAEDTDQLQ